MGLTKHQKEYLKKLRKNKKTRYLSINGVKIKVNPNVFPPATDSKLMASNLKNLRKKKILDITTGSGLFSVIAGSQGAYGIAADINPWAVANAQENIQKHQVSFKVLQSDLFKNIPKQKFDIILVNGPFSEGKPKDWLEYAMLGLNKFVSKFFQNASHYLKKHGQILAVYVDWGNIKFFEQCILKNGFSFSIINSLFSKDKKRKYYLYKIKFAK